LDYERESGQDIATEERRDGERCPRWLQDRDRKRRGECIEREGHLDESCLHTTSNPGARVAAGQGGEIDGELPGESSRVHGANDGAIGPGVDEEGSFKCAA